MKQKYSILSMALIALAGLVFSGCGSGGNQVKVSGQVVENGQPIPVPNYEEGVNNVALVFVPLDESGEMKDEAAHGANASEDGKFTVTGNMGNGIPPGKYRVAVRMTSMSKDGMASDDAWKGKYGPTSSPFVFDISSSTKDLKIDLAEAPKS
ncbi:hypothetical protein [Bremerella cremea]|uniref:hypothetical protein n=1 Tax=Bremerella cremea TaxID=1031537 RepID=UPI0031F02EB3